MEEEKVTREVVITELKDILKDIKSAVSGDEDWDSFDAVNIFLNYYEAKDSNNDIKKKAAVDILFRTFKISRCTCGQPKKLVCSSSSCGKWY